MQKQAEEARERVEKLARHQNQLFEAFTQRFLVPQGGNRPGPVVEYVRQFDHMCDNYRGWEYALDMVQTETEKNVSVGTSDGLKEVLRPSLLQVVKSQQSGRYNGRGGKSQIGGKRKRELGNHNQT